MSAMNQVILYGNLGSAPEVRRLQSGSVVARFSVATNDGYRNREGQWIERTDWHRIVAWGPTAEILERFATKGMPVIVEGRLRTNSYEKEGIRREQTEVNAHRVHLLRRPPAAGPAAVPAQEARSAASDAEPESGAPSSDPFTDEVRPARDAAENTMSFSADARDSAPEPEHDTYPPPAITYGAEEIAPTAQRPALQPYRQRRRQSVAAA